MPLIYLMRRHTLSSQKKKNNNEQINLSYIRLLYKTIPFKRKKTGKILIGNCYASLVSDDFFQIAYQGKVALKKITVK